MTTRQEWLLVALSRRNGQAMTPVQIQKTMFLMEVEAKEFVGPGFYTFVPYNYGPFDANVYHDLDAMESKGLVVSAATSRGWKMFAATPAGMAAAVDIKKVAESRAVNYLEQAVDWVTSLSFTELVRAIYAKYPAYKANSVFTG